MKQEQLYFIAIIPPQPIHDELLKYKFYFKEKFQSKASLNSPPHVTLHMPFQWKEKKEKELHEVLQNFSKGQSEFQIALNNFSCFEPRVVFVDVMLSKELSALQQTLHQTLKRELNIFNANYKNQAFHPHITLAFRDLKKPNFYAAWTEFAEQKFDGNFLVDQIVLLKHSGKVWIPHSKFNFKDCI